MLQNSLFGFQIPFTIPIDKDINPISIKFDSLGILQLASKASVYELSDRGFKKINALQNQPKTNQNQSFDIHEGSILIDNCIFSIKNHKLTAIGPDVANQFWQLKQFNGAYYLAIHDLGLFEIDSNWKSFKLIDSTKVTCMEATDSSLYLGSYGIMFELSKSGEFAGHDYKAQIGDQAIIDIKVDKKGSKHLATSTNYLVHKEGSNIKKLDLFLSSSNEVLSILSDKDNNCWILTKEILFFIPNIPITEHNTKNLVENDLTFYKIRDKTYISNSKVVMELVGNELKTTKIPAPNNVFGQNTDNPILTFNNHYIQINKETAQIKGKNVLNTREPIVDFLSDSKTYCTSKEIHLDNLILKVDEDSICKLLFDNYHKYVITNNRIHQILDKEIVTLTDTDVSFSKNIFLFENHIFFISENTVSLYDTKSGIRIKIPFGKIKLFDIMEYQNEVVLLFPKSLVMIDKQSCLNSTFEITRVIPIFQTIEDGNLIRIDSTEVLINSTNPRKLIKVQLDDSHSFSKPFLNSNKMSFNDSSFISLNSNNYWTNNKNYTLFETSNNTLKTTWTKKPIIPLNNDHGSSYIVKMKDDIFLEDIYSNLNKDVSNSKNLNKIKLTPYLLGFLIYTLLVLWLRKRLGPKNFYDL